MAYVKPNETPTNPLLGKSYLTFVMSNETGENELLPIGFLMDTSLDSEAETTTESTKQGTINASSTLTQTFNLENRYAADDLGINLIRHAFHKTSEKLVHLWLVDISESTRVDSGDKAPEPDGSTIYDCLARYGQGVITSFSESQPVDGFVTITAAIAINDQMKDAPSDNLFELSDNDITTVTQSYAYQSPSEVIAGKA